MSHAGRVAHQAFDASQTFSQSEESGGGYKGYGRLQGIFFQAEGYNAPKSFGLSFRKLMSPMRIQPGVMHSSHKRVLLQELGDALGAGAMLSNPQRKGFYPP